MSNNKNKPVASIFDAQLQELMDIKTMKAKMNFSTKELTAREKVLKADVTTFVKENGPIIFPEGRIEYKHDFVKKTFQRAKTLDYIRETLGDEVADAVDAHCTVINESEGVWIYRNRNASLSDETVDTDDDAAGEV